VREVTPAQLGLEGAAQLILIISTLTEKGKTTTTRQHFVTSRPASQLDPVQILQLRRLQWGIEAICHQRLEVSPARGPIPRPQHQRRGRAGPAVADQLGALPAGLPAATTRA